MRPYLLALVLGSILATSAGRAFAQTGNGPSAFGQTAGASTYTAQGGQREALSPLGRQDRWPFAWSSGSVLPRTPTPTVRPASPTPTPTRLMAGSDVRQVVVRGMAFRQVLGGPAALYLGEGVAPQQGAWAREAMQVAWREAPRTSGLPLPRKPIVVYVLRDQEQFRTYTKRLTGDALSVQGCVAIPTELPEPVILCDAGTLGSWDQTLDFITHELTHHLIQGDLAQQRAVPVWYHEGLSEVVMRRVLAVHAPIYADRDHARRERLATQAAREGKYVRLSAGDQAFRAAPHELAYSQARLAVNWLAERHGMAKVGQVVRQTDSTASSFDRAFAQAFGSTVAEFDRQFEATLRGSQLTAWPDFGRVAPPCLLCRYIRP
jgi:hypothetical protein